jgi:hypothetical protein
MIKRRKNWLKRRKAKITRVNFDFDLSSEKFEVDETDKHNEKLTPLLADLISAEFFSIIRWAAYDIQIGFKDTPHVFNIKH